MTERFVSVRTKFEELEDYQLNISRLKDIIDNNLGAVALETVSIAEQLQLIHQESLGRAIDEYDEIATHHIEKAAEAYNRQIDRYVEGSVTDMEAFIAQYPNHFRIQERGNDQTAHRLLGVFAVGSGLKTQFGGRISEGEVLFKERAYDLQVKS